MGVPRLFRWLCTKYPKIMVDVKEEHAQSVDGRTVEVDLMQPNPNGLEFDNLYLDFNGIIHQVRPAACWAAGLQAAGCWLLLLLLLRGDAALLPTSPPRADAPALCAAVHAPRGRPRA